MTRRKPHEYDWSKAEFDETLLSKHYTAQSSRDIRFVVIHHMVIPDRDPDTDDALDACYDVWQTRRASAHYGVDGKFVRQYVWDKNEAWATGSDDGNDHGISIEHANLTLNKSGTAEDYLIGEETLATSARLVATLHKIHKLGRPSSKTVRKHSDFFATACPGPHFDRIWKSYIAACASAYDALGRGGGAQDVDFDVPDIKPKPKPKPKGDGGFKPLWKPTGDLSVKQIQRIVGVKADGLYGHDTLEAVKRYQRELGVAVDGLWGERTEAAYKRKGKAKPSGGGGFKPLWTPTGKLNVREIQKIVGATVDGLYGHDTKAAVARYQRDELGVTADGYWGAKTERAHFRHVRRAKRPRLRNLKRGSKGRRVRNLQAGLNRAFPAYSSLAVDGIFGRATERAVKEFQRRSGLTADGIVGPKTRKALARYGIKA